MISGYSRVVHRANQFPADDRPSAHLELLGAVDAPRHLGHVLRDAADHFAIELFDDLGAALLPPRLGAGDLPAVLQRQDFRQVGIRVRERLVVVGVVRRGFVAARTRTERLDSELILHVLVVGRRRRGVGIRRRARGRLRAGCRLTCGRRLGRGWRLRWGGLLRCGWWSPLRRGRLLRRPTRAVGHQQRRYSHRGQPDPVRARYGHVHILSDWCWFGRLRPAAAGNSTAAWR